MPPTEVSMDGPTPSKCARQDTRKIEVMINNDFADEVMSIFEVQR
jgi:hypothetical protein